MHRFFRRLARLTPARVVALFILLWLGVAVPLAFAQVPRPWIFAYAGVTLVYSFFIAAWAMLRTAARLRGVLDEGEAPDGGLLLESLPQAAVVLDERGTAQAFNGKWLDLFGLARAHVQRKPYARFCDPTFRRAIDRARRAGEPIRDLPLSTRTPDRRNISFRAVIEPLGDGWLVSAFPEERTEPTAAPYYADDRLYQFGRVGASLLPELIDRLAALRREFAGSDTEALLTDALALSGRLRDVLATAGQKSAEIQPAALLAEAAELVQPAFARRHVQLNLRLRDHLPAIRGHQAHLTYALLVVLLQALEATPEGAEVTAHARSAGDDVEFLVVAPCALTEAPAEELFTPAQTGPSAGLAVARQIVREHDGNLLYHYTLEAGCQLLLQLPSVTK